MGPEDKKNTRIFAKADNLRTRTRDFAARVVKLFQALPKTTEAQVIGKQLLRSGTSVAANYRAVQRARSQADFVSKMGVVIEEADETMFWLELLVTTGIIPDSRLTAISKEAEELLAIFVASRQTAKRS